jgi:replicative DNA helicase
MVLSQISNEGAKNTENPVMSFKGSGAIAAAADLAIEIVNGEMDIQQLREKMNNGEVVRMKWQIRKNRHGRIGYIDMEFSGKTGIFTQFTDQRKVAQEKTDKRFSTI